MEIDWPRTLAAGTITTAVLVAIYAADTYQAHRAGEAPAGAAPGVGGALGIVLALVAANAFLT